MYVHIFVTLNTCGSLYFCKIYLTIKVSHVLIYMHTHTVVQFPTIIGHDIAPCHLAFRFGKVANHLALFSLRTESDNPDATCELCH